MFKTGSPVTGEYFIDRKKDLPLFKSFIDNNQHIMIKAPRRFGKTSIVKHLLQNKEYTFIYIDIRRASNLTSLANEIIEKSYNLLGIENFISKAKSSLFDLIKTIQKIKIEKIGEITIKHLENKTDEVEYFLHSLDIVSQIATKKNINIKFAFDEFQDILEITNNDILNKIRSVIQHHENVTYIFLGSIETIMNKIFSSKKSPFFHFAKIIDLPPFDIKEVFEYANKVFQKENINIPLLKKTLNYFKGHPDYTIQFLQKLYIYSKAYNLKNIDEKLLISYIKETIEDNQAYIDELIIKAKHKKHHLEELINIAQNQKSKLDSKSLYNVRASLENMGLIKKIGIGRYIINDILLEYFLKKRNGIIPL